MMRRKSCHPETASTDGSATGILVPLRSGDDEFGEFPVMVEVHPVRLSVAVMRRGFVLLDDWDLEEVFSRRGSLIFPSGNQVGVG